MTADELRAFRKRLGLTQAQFAERLGIGVSTLHDLERGIDRATGKLKPVPNAIVLACMAPATVWLAS